MGHITLNRQIDPWPAGSLLLVEAMDEAGLADPTKRQPRKSSMPESLVVYDRFGAREGDLIAFTEGSEASNPFRPTKVPMTAYNSMIIDHVST